MSLSPVRDKSYHASYFCLLPQLSRPASPPGQPPPLRRICWTRENRDPGVASLEVNKTFYAWLYKLRFKKCISAALLSPLFRFDLWSSRLWWRDAQLLRQPERQCYYKDYSNQSHPSSQGVWDHRFFIWLSVNQNKIAEFILFNEINSLDIFFVDILHNKRISFDKIN